MTGSAVAANVSTSVSGEIRRKSSVIPIVLSLVVISATRLHSYLLFHTVAELYSIIIAATYFVIAWHTRKLSENASISFLGIVYLFIAFFDFFHTITYTGMNIISGYAFPANQLWVIGRFLEAASLFSFSFIKLNRRRVLQLIIGTYAAYTAAGLASVFVFRVFPACFVQGVGQTSFKQTAEIVIIALLLAAAITLRVKRDQFPRVAYVPLQLSIFLTVFSELSFTLYFSNYDWVNMTGHLLKIASFYLVYRSILVTGLERPQEMLYDRLRQREDELRQANQAKDTFLSILSHDLKGPLFGIKSTSENLAENPEFARSENAPEVFREMTKSSDMLLSLVEGVLSWARSQSGSIQPHPKKIDLAEEAKSQINFLRETAAAKGITVENQVDEGSFVSADPEMVRVILRNLIHNAIKFTQPGGSVKVTSTKRSGNWTIAVSDTGIGMETELIDRLFLVEQKISRKGTAGERGTGFGLVLAAEFAAKMGGRLEVSSTQGKGSTFRLVLPSAER